MLGNATLKITSLPGESIGTSKHIVIKADKVDGEFGKVINELALVTATPDYTTETEVGLTLTLKEVAPTKITDSENGKATLGSIVKQVEPEPPGPGATTTPTRKRKHRQEGKRVSKKETLGS